MKKYNRIIERCMNDIDGKRVVNYKGEDKMVG